MRARTHTHILCPRLRAPVATSACTLMKRVVKSSTLWQLLFVQMHAQTPTGWHTTEQLPALLRLFLCFFVGIFAVEATVGNRQQHQCTMRLYWQGVYDEGAPRGCASESEQSLVLPVSMGNLSRCTVHQGRLPGLFLGGLCPARPRYDTHLLLAI